MTPPDNPSPGHSGPGYPSPGHSGPGYPCNSGHPGGPDYSGSGHSGPGRSGHSGGQGYSGPGLGGAGGFGGVPGAFPGGTSVSRLSVYEIGACADGLEGGTPHLHTASTEAYVVVGGRGALHTLDLRGPRETELGAGSTVWFTPGTIHRAVNGGGLEVVVVMSNAGLPEAGDAVMTFPPEIVADPDRYAEAATLPDGTPEEIEAAVVRRRELAVEGFQRLSGSAARGDLGPLRDFYASAVALVRPRAARWREIWEDTVAREARRTSGILDALARGDAAHLGEASLMESPPQQRWGMCGHLRAHDVAHPITHTSDET